MLCGGLARIGATAIRLAKHLAPARGGRIAVAVCGSVTLALVAQSWFGGPVHLGPGYLAIEWAGDQDHTVLALAGLFGLRAVATWVAVAGGGVGGLFIPLVTQGAVVGALVDQLLPASNPHLLPTVGIAAFLGAGYCTPLAGVAFVAEATGQAGFVVPSLLAAAAAQLVMGVARSAHTSGSNGSASCKRSRQIRWVVCHGRHVREPAVVSFRASG